MVKREITGVIRRDSVDKWHFKPDDEVVLKVVSVDAIADLLSAGLHDIPIGEDKPFKITVEVE